MAGRAVATWTVELKPSEKTNYRLHAYADLKISNAALDPVLADHKGRSTVILHVDDDDLDSEDEDDESESSPPKLNKPKRLVLTSLTPGKIESSIHDIVIARPANVTFEVIGTNTIHLSGYLFVPPGDDEEDEDEDEDEMRLGMPFSDEESSEYGITAGDIGDFDSDEIMDDSHRFEEIMEDEPPVEEKNKSNKKRPRESDELDTADAVTEHKQKKKAKKEKRDEATSENPLEAKKEDNAKGSKKTADVIGKPKGSKSKDLNDVKENGTKPSKSSKGEEKGDKQSQNSNEKLKLAKSTAFTELASGLRIRDPVKGEGRTAKAGSTVKLRYIAKLLKVDQNGKVATDGDVFDSNTKGKPFTVKLGEGEVIKGFDQGVTGMVEGGERVVYIPPNLGYGKRGSPPAVPPNANLRFEIKLLRVV